MGNIIYVYSRNFSHSNLLRFISGYSLIKYLNIITLQDANKFFNICIGNNKINLNLDQTHLILCKIINQLSLFRLLNH